MDSMINKEYRCDCGKLLFRGILSSSRLEIKCLRCGKILTISDLNISNDSDGSYSIAFKPDGEIVDASLSIEKILGYKPGELIGSKIYKISMTLTEGFFNTILRDVAKSKSVLRVEVEHKRKNGRKIKLHASIKYVEDKSGGLYFGYYEITNTRASNRLKVPEKFEMSACDVVTEFNMEQICTYIDPAVYKFTGYEAIEFIGQSMFKHSPKHIVKMAKIYLKYFAPRRKPRRKFLSSLVFC